MSIFSSSKPSKPSKSSILVRLCLVALICGIFTGCATKEAVKAAGSKSIDIDGYMMLGVIETVSDTGTPQGKLLIGNAKYKSRRLSVPATEQIPNAGNFKHTTRTTLFGTSETITEWDYTASTPDSAKAIQAALTEQASVALSGDSSADKKE